MSNSQGGAIGRALKGQLQNRIRVPRSRSIPLAGRYEL
jgi:hypothetical protein